MRNRGKIYIVRLRQLAAVMDKHTNTFPDQVTHMLLQALQGHGLQKMIGNVMLHILQPFLRGGDDGGLD
ncbi:MAG: hypothetical protein K0R57_2797 [Paenibacillaceae bacterium]|nr:hypothetical protein [Paenibacillaceae bacterium]